MTHGYHTDDGSTLDDAELFIVLSIDEAEQIVTAARHDGNAAAVIEALALLVDRAGRFTR